MYVATCMKGQHIVIEVRAELIYYEVNLIILFKLR